MLLLLTSALPYMTAFGWWEADISGASWVFLFSDSAAKQAQIYNLLFVLVFGFATLNILSLVARRFEPETGRSRLSFGETIAVTVVLVSIVLLGRELLGVFKIFPLKIHLH